MTSTTRLALPLIEAAQAQKHVTHNEALAVLDALVQAGVLDRDLTAPPASPGEGARYIVATGATGAWAGQDGAVAAWQGGGWVFLPPQPGWRVFVVDEPALVVWTGSAWADLIALAAHALQNLDRLGIGTTADATNPLAAKLNTALFTARGTGEGGTGDLRYTMNKEAAARTVSLLMQSAYSGRAEIGLAGSDDLAVKVSADGASWTTALKVAAATGQVAMTGAVPATDNAHSLGTASLRWSQVYAANATISTSDARLKTDIAADVPGLAFVRALKPVTYRWRDADGRGAPGRRRHLGFLAQEVAALCGQRDLALWTRDVATGQFGLRYEQFAPVLARAIQDLAERLDRLESPAPITIPIPAA